MFKPERTEKVGHFEVLVDCNENTGERRVSVYRGETLLAIEFVPTIETRIDRLIASAMDRSRQFPVHG